MQASRVDRATVCSDPDRVAEQLGALLRALLVDPRSDHLRAIEERNLSITQVRTLALLDAGEDAELSAGALAERLDLSPAAMSRALDALVRRRLVARRESRSDRRVRLASLTPRGRELIGELLVRRDRGLARFLEGASPEARTQLSAALLALGSGREQNERAGRGRTAA